MSITDPASIANIWTRVRSMFVRVSDIVGAIPALARLTLLWPSRQREIASAIALVETIVRKLIFIEAAEMQRNQPDQASRPPRLEPVTPLSAGWSAGLRPAEALAKQHARQAPRAPTCQGSIPPGRTRGACASSSARRAIRWPAASAGPRASARSGGLRRRHHRCPRQKRNAASRRRRYVWPSASKPCAAPSPIHCRLHESSRAYCRASAGAIREPPSVTPPPPRTRIAPTKAIRVSLSMRWCSRSSPRRHSSTALDLS